MIKGVLDKHKVPRLIDSCNVRDMTSGEVNKKASLPNGGKLLAILGEAGPTVKDSACFSDTWWSSVTRRSLVLPYVKAIMQQEKDKKNMFSVQAFIQQDSIEVPKDSALNLDIYGWVKDAVLKGVNLLEVNSICSYGNDIAQLLGATVSKSDRQQCKKACGSAWATVADPAGECSSKWDWSSLSCVRNWNKCGSAYVPKYSAGWRKCNCECSYRG